MAASYAAEERHTSAIGRITKGRQRWRVLVETWRDAEAFRGRLLFRPDPEVAWDAARESAVTWHGCSREDVLLRAYDMPEDHLRRVLHSLC